MKKKKMYVLNIVLNVLKEILHAMPLKSIFISFLLIMSALNGLIYLKFIDYIIKTAYKVAGREETDITTIVIHTLVFVGSILLTNMFKQYYYVYKISFNAKMEEHINTNIKSKLAKISYEYYESSTIYEKLYRVNEKAINGFTAVIESIIRIVEIILYMLVYILFLADINLFFAVLITVAIFFSGIFATKMAKNNHKMFVDITKLNQKRDYLDGLVKDKITHQEYQTGRLYRPLLQEYEDTYESAKRGYLGIHKYTIFAEARALMMFAVTIFVAYLYLSLQIDRDILDVSIVVSIMVIFDNLYTKSESLSYFLSKRTEDYLIIGEYYEILQYNEYNKNDREQARNTEIRFSNVSYSYPQSEKKALNKLQINISKGEKVAIVGANGSGKSTFTNILLGLLTSFDGEVIIDNKKYTKDNPIPIGVVKAISQDFVIFQTSIEDNIFWGKTDVDYKEKSEIFERAGIEQFIKSLTYKEQTMIGQLDEDGTDLSKGQEQKIALARMLAENESPIWILDEPTAYLDPLAEIEMYKLLYQMPRNKTMLFISHRLGFAPMADRIIVFDHGQVVECGKHTELLQKKGIYARMYDAQKAWYEEGM